jgi:hypothetical protein
MTSRLEQQVTAAIAKCLDRTAEEIEPSHRLRRDLGLCNLRLIRIALDLERPGLGEFPFESLQDVATVSDLCRLHRRFCRRSIAKQAHRHRRPAFGALRRD